MGKGDMTEMPTQSLDTFFKIVAYCAEIALHVNEKNPSIENCQNRQCLVHKATRQGCPRCYIDVKKQMELMGFPSELLLMGYGDFYLASQGHSGTPTNFNRGIKTKLNNEI